MNQPASFTESHDDRMIRKFGSKEAFDRVKKAHDLIGRGAEVGLDGSMGFTQAQLDLRVQSSTLDSHRLVLFVEQEFGVEKSEALYSQFNERHFLQAGVLNDRTLLHASIASIGLDEQQQAVCVAFLQDSQRGREQTLDLYRKTQAPDMRVDSIPTLVVDGQYMLSGAAHSDEVARILGHAVQKGLSGKRAFAPAAM